MALLVASCSTLLGETPVGTSRDPGTSDTNSSGTSTSTTSTGCIRFTGDHSNDIDTGSIATDALTFQVFGGAVAPVVGQTIALWDKAARTFRRKRVLTVTGVGPWNLVCTAANGASDQSYTPVVGQGVSPWSDSLEALVEPVLEHFATRGPGELFLIFDQYTETRPQEGRRRRREPRSPIEWPNRTDSEVFVDLQALVEVETIVPPENWTITIDPVIPPMMWVLDDFVVYPGA